MKIDEIVLIIIRLGVILIALWPYVCLTYLTELKKISKELKSIKLEIRKLKEETKCEDTSTELIG